MFDFVTQEHRMIREAVSKLLTGLEAIDTERRQRDNTRIDDATIGRALGELGLFGTDADDASMASAQVQAAVAIETGSSALPFPVLETLATHALMMRVGGATAQGPSTTRTLSSATAELSELPVLNDGRLDGNARLVPFVHLADHAVIGARFGSEIVLVDVELNDAGVSRQRRDCVETDYPVQDLGFCSVAAAPLSDSAQARGGDSAFLRQRTALLAAAEIAGACRRMVQMTRDYLLLRSQFGQVLGANQALKHALADNYVKVEALIAAIEYAAAAVDAGAIDAEVSVCAAKHYAGRAGKAVADSTLQMHGAIGYTMEFPLHRFMKRVFRLSVSHGSGRIQGERLFEMFRQQV